MSDALERLKEVVFDFDFEDFSSYTEGVRDYAQRQFYRIATLAALCDEDAAMAVWIDKCKREVPHPKYQEWLAALFRKHMTQERKALAAKDVPKPETFLYDGWPVVRKPRVYHVPQDAGREPVGIDRADEGRVATEADYDHDIERLKKALKVVVSWFDRDEGSAYDVTGYIDYVTRAVDSLLENKRKYLGKLHAEMRALERAARSESEFDEQAWIRLSEMKQRVLRSGYLFRDALLAHHEVRGEVYAFTGLDMKAFRSRAEMQKDAEHYRKLKVQIIDADKLVGLSPEEFAVWRRVTGQDVHGVLVDPDSDPMKDRIGGVNALPDEVIAGSARDVKNVAERQRRAAKKEAGIDARFERTKPRAVPKPDVKIEPSGAKGSRYQALRKQQK